MKNSVWSILVLASLIVGLSTVSNAASVTWTLMPESSAAWNIDPYFGAVSNNPTDILSGISVDFIGFTHPGGSAETLNGAHLVYRWRLDFDAPVTISSISMTGLGDETGNSIMQLLDQSQNVLLTHALTGFNNLHTTVLNGPSPIGTTFYYDEFDRSTDGRYRSNLTVDFSAAQQTPEPATFVLLVAGVGGALSLSKRRHR